MHAFVIHHARGVWQAPGPPHVRWPAGAGALLAKAFYVGVEVDDGDASHLRCNFPGDLVVPTPSRDQAYPTSIT